MKDDTKRLLGEYCLTPNKALGQNFLSDDGAAARIVALAECKNKSVLEIGPGMGALTDLLLESAARVAAVEIDRAMVDVLNARFEGSMLTVLHRDFLKVRPEELTPLLPPPVTVVGNLPYYITTPICTRLFTLNIPICRMVLMVQKDAAPRFTARPGDRVYGPMTVLCDHLFHAEETMELSPSSYYPEPQVESAVIVFTRRDTEFLPSLSRLVTAAFAMRRKTLANNLKALGLTAADIERAGISPSVRAEALTTEEFLRLCAVLDDKEHE